MKVGRFIVQTDHSSLRHLPNQPSVNRRIWKWVSILQGYDMEIRHIPGKINPADTITRQVRSEDQIYAGEVKQMDNELVDAIRIPVEASDADAQKKLDQLYSKDGTRDKLKEARQQVLTTNEEILSMQFWQFQKAVYILTTSSNRIYSIH